MGWIKVRSKKMRERYTINKDDIKGAITNAIWFTAPVILIYLYSIINVLQQPECVFGWKVFVPDNTVIIAMVLWVLNRFVYFFRRFIKSED